jgi:hypothetical protein
MKQYILTHEKWGILLALKRSSASGIWSNVDPTGGGVYPGLVGAVAFREESDVAVGLMHAMSEGVRLEPEGEGPAIVYGTICVDARQPGCFTPEEVEEAGLQPWAVPPP